MDIILSVCAHGYVLRPILILLLYNLFSRDWARRNFVWFAGAAAIGQIVSSAVGYVAMNALALPSYDFSVLWERSAAGAAYFELTQPRFVLLLVVGLVTLASALIAHRTVDRNRSSYTNLLLILLLGMNGMLLVSDLFSLYVFMEVTGISCFVLIEMFRTRADLEGAFKYLVMSELASVFILSGFAFLFMKNGSLRYEDLAGFSAALEAGSMPDLLAHVGLIFILSGFALKAGVVPFHSWLPDAHQSADTAVSVLLSGVVIKIAGVYGLLTIVQLFGSFAPVRITLAAFGLLTIVAGALLAARQGHFKRVVAYSSVSQMGYILLGLSTGTTLGLVAALAHVLSHASFKSTLFANAAALHEQAGTLELDELGGLDARMPATAFSSVVAFLSTAGVPPTAGFWSKLLILLALWTSGAKALAGAALLSSILTAAYLLRLQRRVFFGRADESKANVTEIRGTVLAAELLLTAVTIGVGLAFPAILAYLHARGIL